MRLYGGEGRTESHDSFWASSVLNLLATHTDGIHRSSRLETQIPLAKNGISSLKECKQKRKGGIQAKISDIPTIGVGVKQEEPREKNHKRKRNKKPEGLQLERKRKKKSQGECDITKAI